MTTTDTKPTRVEDAYAHLASFQRGDMVDVAGRRFYQPGTVTTAQQHDHAGINRAYLIVTGCGTETRVTVGALLSGKHTITSQAERGTGLVRHFDAVSYAMQNQGELQARVDAEMRERAYNEAHYLNDASAYFPGDHP